MARSHHDRTLPAHLLVAGGGSGGHIFPGLAVARLLEEEGWKVSWAGTPQGMEARLLPQERVDFHPLPARPLLGRGPVGRLRALTTLLRSAFAARRLVKRIGAGVVLGTGGYVSAPAVLGARLAGRPALLLEPNSQAGAANRLLSRFASAAAVAFPETASQLSCLSEVTGVPVRSEFFEAPAEDPPAEGPLSLLVLGGSQGARQLNDLVPAAAALLEGGDHREMTIVHQSGGAVEGGGGAAEVAAAYARAGVLPARLTVTSFIEDVAGAMAACHLVISRAGAITVAEIAAAGRGAILVPLAIAAGHQAHNARALVDAGAARLLLPDEATPERLGEHLGELLDDRDALVRMGQAARGLARPDAARAIAGKAAELAGRQLDDRSAGGGGGGGGGAEEPGELADGVLGDGLGPMPLVAMAPNWQRPGGGVA